VHEIRLCISEADAVRQESEAVSSIEDRVSKLEEVVFAKKRPEKDWRSTVGKFDNDPFMGVVIDGALRSREEERKNIENTANETNTESK
jgi:hypothetical protein